MPSPAEDEREFADLRQAGRYGESRNDRVTQKQNDKKCGNGLADDNEAKNAQDRRAALASSIERVEQHSAPTQRRERQTRPADGERIARRFVRLKSDSLNDQAGKKGAKRE